MAAKEMLRPSGPDGHLPHIGRAENSDPTNSSHPELVAAATSRRLALSVAKNTQPLSTTPII